MSYSIEQFKSLNRLNNIIITQHGRKRLIERKIKAIDICSAINTGTIIEDYPNSFPFPCCLILGYADRKPLHICASINEGYIYIITAYVPDTDKWDLNLKTRKDETK